MNIKTAKYIISAAKEEQYPLDYPVDFAFVGRSNVGKSSLINALTRHSKLAKTSKTPGRTQLVNFFDINSMLYFVDLPGYGFAKVPKEMKKEWGKSMERYLVSERKKVVFVLLDIRRVPNDDDLMILNWCEHYKVPYKIIFTKCDKLSNNEKFKQIKLIKKRVEFDDGDVYFHSSLKKTGNDEILAYIEKFYSELNVNENPQ